MNDKANSANLGMVVSVRGSVVDVRFDALLPAIYSVPRHIRDLAALFIGRLHAHVQPGVSYTFSPSSFLVTVVRIA